MLVSTTEAILAARIGNKATYHARYLGERGAEPTP